MVRTTNTETAKKSLRRIACGLWFLSWQEWYIQPQYFFHKRGESEIHSVLSDSLGPHGLYSLRNSPGQNTGVGSLSLLQGIFPTQESNQSLLHFRQILYQLSYERLSLSAQLLFPTMAIINILPTLWPSDSRTFLSELSEYCFPLHQETVSIMWGFF